MPMLNHWIIWLLIGYTAGSIPFSLLIGLAKGVDIRKQGSGNVGATNVGRVLGKPYGIACFLLDVAKGALPVAIAGQFIDHNTVIGQWQWLAVAAAAVLGHVFPVWLKFKGGKGVATSFGVLLGFWPTLTLPALLAIVTWIICVAIWRYISLASIVAAVLLPAYLIGITQFRGQAIVDLMPFLIVCSLLALLVILRHLTNIKRLIAGTESKVLQKKALKPQADK
ncbi:MAG: glycerol-3-phosphate 1-O-acyltransferase PlsY [Phycisphaeraceae bacterium]|nr:glycerol-3-phosphate 1-O-acyltransferase PlsY [Phycisphaeraceae bacterium]